MRDITNKESYPPFIIDVWDKDEELFDSEDDYLGRAVIYAHEASMNL